NNQYRERGVEEYRGQFEALLRRAIGLAGGRADRVLVLSVPDWGVTAFAAASGRDRGVIAAGVDGFNAAAGIASRGSGVAFLDLPPVSRARGNEPEMLAADGLHPSVAMYALWAQLARPVARDLLTLR